MEFFISLLVIIIALTSVFPPSGTSSPPAVERVALELSRPAEGVAIEKAAIQRGALDRTLVAMTSLELEVGRSTMQSTPIIIRLQRMENRASAIAVASGAAGRSVERASRASILDPRAGADFPFDDAVAALDLSPEAAALAVDHVLLAMEALDKVLGLAGSDGWPDPRSPPTSASLAAFRGLDAAIRRLASTLDAADRIRLLALWAVHRFPELRVSAEVPARVAELIDQESARLSRLWLDAEADRIAAGSDARADRVLEEELELAVGLLRQALQGE